MTEDDQLRPSKQAADCCPFHLRSAGNDFLGQPLCPIPSESPFRVIHHSKNPQHKVGREGHALVWRE